MAPRRRIMVTISDDAWEDLAHLRQVPEYSQLSDSEIIRRLVRIGLDEAQELGLTRPMDGIRKYERRSAACES